jgi:hypothetical protein
MRVTLLHKLAEHIPEDYVPPQKPIADVGKMVTDARDAGLLRMTGSPQECEEIKWYLRGLVGPCRQRSLILVL